MLIRKGYDGTNLTGGYVKYEWYTPRITGQTRPDLKVIGVSKRFGYSEHILYQGIDPWNEEKRTEVSDRVCDFLSRIGG